MAKSGSLQNNLGGNWSRRAVVYQIYPRSFKDSDHDGIGDLQGIIEKLDYLNDGTENSLGIGAIWLSPVYRSPMVDFGYDVSDHKAVDPIFGDLKTFDRLLTEAHKRGIKVIMDFIPNHTSDQHPWFLESRSAQTNHKRDWYIWRDPKPDGGPPNNWLSVFGGSGWTFDDQTKQYYFHSFLPQQPDLNWRNPEVREEMFSVLKFWLNRGVDGFRTDAAYHLIKDDQFRDDPPNPNYMPGSMDPYEQYLHLFSQGQDQTLANLSAFCEILGEHEDRFIVSEAYLDLTGLEKMYKACEDSLHAPFNFNLIGMPWDAQEVRKFIDQFDSLLPSNKWPNYVLGNHDRARVASRLNRERARIMAMLILTLRGMPFIYYGDELGLLDTPIPEEATLDPWGKRVPGFNLNRDPERTPMPWDDSSYAGFSGHQPWLPVGPDYKTHNVAAEGKDQTSFLSLYKTLIHFRTSSPALLTGTYESFDLANQEIFAYRRNCPAEAVVVLLNFSDQAQTCAFDQREYKLISSTYMDDLDLKAVLGQVTLRPYEGYVLSLKK